MLPDGKGESLSDCARETEACRRGTNLDVAKRASPLALQMDPIARDISISSGGDQLMRPDAVAKISHSLHDFFALDAPDLAYPAVARSRRSKRATQATDEFST